MVSDHDRAASARSCVTCRMADALPPVCVVCGAAATGNCWQRVEVRADASASLPLKIIGGTVAVLESWIRATSLASWLKLKMPNEPESRWIRLPHCAVHRAAKTVRQTVTVRAVGRHQVAIGGAAAAFCAAVAALGAPPSAETLAALDRGPTQRPSEFLNAIHAPTAPTSAEFLRNLEEHQDR